MDRQGSAGSVNVLSGQRQSSRAARTVLAALVAALLLCAAARANAQDLPAPPEAEPTPAPPGVEPTPAPPGVEPTPPPQGPAPEVAPAADPTSVEPPKARLRAPTRFSRYRTNWYIGLGIGGGAGWFTVDGEDAISDGGVSFLFRVGGVITPWFLAGFEYSIWSFPGDDEVVGYQFNHFDVMATVFPLYDTGMFIKGGVGVGLVHVNADDYQDGFTETGFDVKVGGGWEWQISRSFTLGLELSYGWTAHDGGSTNDVAGNLTFSWY